MPRAHLVKSTPVQRSARVMQLEGIFEMPPTRASELTWEVDIPIDDRPWNIGLIVGPSGSGKTTVLRELFQDADLASFDWPSDRSVVDAFPAEFGIKEIVALLTSVGFSSPPSWLRPYRALSNGEQFRVALARSLAEATAKTGDDRATPIVVDEFTSVVDRTVARIGSAAVAKAIRQRDLRLVAASCHYDIVQWLAPDWIFEPASGSFSWRSVQSRPKIALEIRPARRNAWSHFKRHHYLSGSLNPAARCYVGLVRLDRSAVSERSPVLDREFCSDKDMAPAAFTAVVYFPHPNRPGWRESRTVCLPEFQGVGIGNAMSDFVASLYRSTGKPYRSVTSNPAMIHHRARSPAWRMVRPPSRTNSQRIARLRKTAASSRVTASFEYVGPPRPEDARRFGIA